MIGVLKTLPRASKITADWKIIVNQLYRDQTRSVVEDYERIVTALMELQIVEEYLRKEVLQNDDRTDGLRKTVELAYSLGYFISTVDEVVSLPGARDWISRTKELLYLLQQHEVDRQYLRRFRPTI